MIGIQNGNSLEIRFIQKYAKWFLTFYIHIGTIQRSKCEQFRIWLLVNVSF